MKCGAQLAAAQFPCRGAGHGPLADGAKKRLIEIFGNQELHQVAQSKEHLILLTETKSAVAAFGRSLRLCAS
jgi:hypothetical protein